jgi:methyl-accepting chemotaxis protein WspA
MSTGKGHGIAMVRLARRPVACRGNRSTAGRGRSDVPPEVDPANSNPPRTTFFRSLAGRLVMLGVVPAFLLVAGVLAWNAVNRFESMEQHAKDGLLREALVLASDIESSNEEAVRTARLIAIGQEAGLFGDRARTVESLRRILAATPGITGTYVGYEPDADGQDAASAARDPAGWREPEGRFVPYFFRDWRNGNALAVKPLVDYETSLYYDGCRRLFRERGEPTAILTEPYVYEGQLIVEQTFPIVIDGQFRGIGGTDRALADLERIVRERIAAVGADAFLVSGRGNFVVATVDPAIGVPDDGRMALRATAVAGSPPDSLVEPLLAEADDDGLVRDMVDSRDGTTWLAAAVRIPTGDWTLVVVKPREAVLGPIRAAILGGAIVPLVALGLAGGLVAWLALRAGRRIRHAALAADAIAAGDLAVRIPPCPSSDEAGWLVRSLIRMRDDLAALLGEVKEAGVTLDTSAHELSASGREQSEMARRFGASTSGIAAASRQIGTTGQELARTMEAVDAAAKETAELAGGSRRELVAADQTIRELSDGTESIAGKLARISERAEAINAVVAVIARVADRTNLLSVNAAIEAEKAGEEGRGFLVVAREIRRLADQTAEATGQVTAIVRDTQSAVGAGVMEMDRFAQNVRRGVEQITRSSRQMEELIARVEANAGRFRTVSDGMQSQVQGAATIASSLAELVATAKRAVESADEFARTATELQRASGTLRSSVGRFRTGA